MSVRVPVFAVGVVDRPRGQIGHPLDGRYGALKPADLGARVDELVEVVDVDAVDVVLGLAEGGYLPAYAFAERASLPVVLSSRIHHDLPDIVTFHEPHATDVGTAHYVVGLAPGARVLIVEDEVTTGVTLVAAVDALRAAGMVVTEAATVLCVDDPGILARLRAVGVRLHVAAWIPVAIRDALTETATARTS